VRRGLAAVLLAAVLLAGCGGGKDKKADTASKAGSTSTTASTTSTTAATGTSATAASTNGTTSKGSGKGATASPTAKPATGGSSANSGPQPAAAGRYTYNRTGKASTTAFGEQSLDGAVTLQVDPAANGEQHSKTTSSEGEREQVLRFLAEGAYFTDLKQSTSGFAKEFRPNPPVLAMPTAPASHGPWQWTVTSTDGKTTLSAAFKYLRTETLAIGGEQVSTVVLGVTLQGSGDITFTTNETDWVAPSKSLIVRTDQKTDGTISGVQFHSESTQTLQTTRPA
jgi:hypothetical protein